MIPWYIPIISAIIGGLIGWFTRSQHDAKAGCRANLQRTLDAVMKETDGGPEKQTDEAKLWALLRHGALLLPDQDFDKLIDSMTVSGRGFSPDNELVGRLSVKGCLTLAAANRVDLKTPFGFMNMLIKLTGENTAKQLEDRLRNTPES